MNEKELKDVIKKERIKAIKAEMIKHYRNKY